MTFLEGWSTRVALSGNTLVVGDYSANANTGAVDIFETSPHVALGCAHATCTAADALAATFSAMLSSAPHPFVTLALAGSPDASALESHDTGGTDGGAIAFAAQPVGTYVARLFDDVGHKIAESAPLAVTDAPPPRVTQRFDAVAPLGAGAYVVPPSK